MKTTLIVGNWKMHGSVGFARTLAKGIRASSVCSSASDDNVGVVCCPPFPYLVLVAEALNGSAIKVGAQQCHTKAQGAYTGDVSAPMLADVGCSYVIVGHSERRREHGEDNDTVALQALAAVHAGMTPIICVGETLEQHQRNETIEIVQSQISAVTNVLGDRCAEIVLAYEPVWAIGTGLAATPDHIAYVHSSIAAMLPQGCDHVAILYGGSVTATNAASIFSCACVHGALVGGASLQVETFEGIVEAARRTREVGQ